MAVSFQTTPNSLDEAISFKLLAQGSDVATMCGGDRWREARKLRVRSMISKGSWPSSVKPALLCVDGVRPCASNSRLVSGAKVIPPVPDWLLVLVWCRWRCVFGCQAHGTCTLARPLQEHGQDWCPKRSILGDQLLNLQFQCKPSSFAQISTYCLLTVSPEIPLSQ